MSQCLECGEIITGRSDKRFCTPYCKSAYHYKKSKEKEMPLFVKIDRQLKKNRQILKIYNKAGLSIVRKEEIVEAGFDPKYFTHYWKAANGNVYLFCYEYGFSVSKEENATKYVLVTWQKYMEKNIP